MRICFTTVFSLWLLDFTAVNICLQKTHLGRKEKHLNLIRLSSSVFTAAFTISFHTVTVKTITQTQPPSFMKCNILLCGSQQYHPISKILHHIKFTLYSSENCSCFPGYFLCLNQKFNFLEVLFTPVATANADGENKDFTDDSACPQGRQRCSKNTFGGGSLELVPDGLWPNMQG